MGIDSTNLSNLCAEPQKYTAQTQTAQTSSVTNSTASADLVRTPEKDSFQKTETKAKSELTNEQKGLFAGIAALAVGVGVFIATKGKKNKTLKEAAEKAAKETEELAAKKNKEMNNLHEEALTLNRNFDAKKAEEEAQELARKKAEEMNNLHEEALALNKDFDTEKATKELAEKQAREAEELTAKIIKAKELEEFDKSLAEKSLTELEKISKDSLSEDELKILNSAKQVLKRAEELGIPSDSVRKDSTLKTMLLQGDDSCMAYGHGGATVYNPGLRAYPDEIDDNNFMPHYNEIISKKPGEIIQDHGYAYTSFDKQVGEYWSGDNRPASILYEIQVPKSAKVSRAKGSQQSEMLFPRRSQFKVISNSGQNENGFVKIVMEYIPNL